MKKRTLVSVLLLCVLILSACTSSPPGIDHLLEPGQPQTQPAAVDRLPNLSESYDSHILLQWKEYGACDSLTGNVLLTMIMVEDDQSTWTESDLEAYKQLQEAETHKLLQEAREFGVDLNLTVHYETCRITGTVSTDDYEDWVNAVLSAANLPEQNEVIPYLKQHYGVKEAPVFFCANYTGRPFSIEWDQGDYFEYSVLYNELASFRHELYHLFGAIDLYYPDAVEQLGNQYFPGSIMLTAGYEMTDNLTAYLIGWTDTVSAEAQAILDDTAWITKEYLEEQKALETLTGHGTIRWGEGTYTGDLVSGVPNGKGKILWDNGNTYEGEWKDGTGHGYGVCHWYTEHCSYAGDWVEWEIHGYGTYTFSDGTVRTGRWDNGNFLGD